MELLFFCCLPLNHDPWPLFHTPNYRRGQLDARCSVLPEALAFAQSSRGDTSSLRATLTTLYQHLPASVSARAALQAPPWLQSKKVRQLHLDRFKRRSESFLSARTKICLTSFLLLCSASPRPVTPLRANLTARSGAEL
jgi:hypothetical protein